VPIPREVMGSSDFSKSNGEDATEAVQRSGSTGLAMPAVASFPDWAVEKSPGAPLFSIPIGAFYNKLPEELLTLKKPDLSHLIHIAWEDVVPDADTKEVTILLSILSLSCPEIFARPVESADDVTITFPLDQLKTEPGQDGLHTEITAEGSAQPAAGASPTQESRIKQAATTAEDSPKKDTSAASDEIKVKLAPILADLPPEIELLSPLTLPDPEIEIALPIDLVRSQLKDGRVAIEASLLCAALPEVLKPIFGKIEPTAAISIPLREIFRKLSSDAIELREDYTLGYSLETIRTPFTVQAEEDALRLAKEPGFYKSPAAGSKRELASETEGVAAQMAQITPEANETKAAAAKPIPLPVTNIEFPTIFDSHALQALLMTEEILDLGKTIERVSELPGLRSCLLTTAQGTKLAGKLVGPAKETAISPVLPRIFQQLKSALGEALLLEGMTLYFDQDPLSIIQVNELCLIVAHDNRPFRPGVREKLFSVLGELDEISHAKKRS
jgi:hypothetical protein